MGRGFRKLDHVETAVIKVGGLPQQPHPPLGYRVVYALESYLNQYVRPALIVRDGQPVEVEPMADLELDDFPPPAGRCECFITDGLATLPLRPVIISARRALGCPPGVRRGARPVAPGVAVVCGEQQWCLQGRVEPTPSGLGGQGCCSLALVGAPG